MCPVILNSTCVFYEGSTLIYTGITTNDSLQTALQKIDAKFGDANVGYTFTNGVVQLSTGQPVKLGGSLIENTTIGGNFTLSFVGPIIGSKLATAGGTSAEFLKGDGTLDNTPYQVAGNYITNLSGDVVASGPGTAVATLASVNANPGTYGDATHVPRINVDSKGRVLSVTSTAIALPSSVLSFTGDVYGSGNTGSTTTLTLNDVNSNVYTSNTFLKFKVNAKGLVTGATPVTGLDIQSVLGYTPVPESRTLTINGVTYDLSANRSWNTGAGAGTVTSVGATAGTGISVSVANPTTTPNITITNTAPDRIVSLTAGSNVTITGSYPNFTIASSGGGGGGGSVNSVTASAPLASSGGTDPNITIAQASTSTDGYLSSIDWNTFNSKQASGNYITDLTGEATASGPGSANVTLSNSAVTGKVLTGVNITGGTVVATDTILEGFGKLQNQINGLIGGSIYQGTWDASTNTPALASGVGTNGYYYIVSVAGNTNLNGITDWKVGDWAIFHGSAWQKVDNTDAVVSVNGYAGAVSLVSSDIPEGLTNLYWTSTRFNTAFSGKTTTDLTEGTNLYYTAARFNTAFSGKTTTDLTEGTNLYYTNTRARQAISLTTTGTSGAATYDNSTGVLNIPNYTTDLSGYVPSTRTLTINGTTYDLSADRSWTVAGSMPAGGTAGQILAKIDATDYNTEWIDNYATQVKNEVKLGAALTKGTPVYVSSANGTNMIVSASSNTTEATSSKTFGLLETGGALNDLVKCVTYGLLAGLDTSAANAAGDPVWLGPNGTLLYGLANKPYAPAHMVYIGVVTRKQSNNGEIFINIQNGFEMDELHNVSARNPDNNAILAYNTSTSLWEKNTIAGVLGYTPEQPLTFSSPLSRSTNTVSIPAATSSVDGYLSSTDWFVFNSKQAGSGNLTSLTNLIFSSESFVKMTGPDTFALDTTAYYPASNPNGYTSNTGTVTSVAALTIGTAGTDLSSSVATGTTTPVITLNVPTASATNRGALSAADWTTFNNKQNALTNPITGSLTANYIPKATGATTLGNSILYNGAAGIGVNTITPRASLDVSGNIYSNDVWIQDSYSLLFGDLTAGSSSTYIYGIGGSGTNYLGFATNGVEGIRLLASRQLKLNAYTATTSFTGTAAGVLAFDSSGNILTIATPGGTTLNGTGFVKASGTTISYDNSTYVPTTGTGATGTWGISISGNAATASNTSSISSAVGGAYTWTGIQYFQSNLGGYSGSLSSPPLEAYCTGANSAFMSFHRGGSYAVNMGLDADNVIRIGGWSASANRLQMDMSGNLTMAGDVTAYSDARVKENVITVDNALEKVLALRGVYYNRTDSEDKRKKIGVIAQETLEVIPEVVSQDNDGMYNVSYGNLAGLFIEAFKEQQKEIEELKKLVNQLLNK
jgi:predicted heme/steroid binding protein